jgi:hypothetical protein
MEYPKEYILVHSDEDDSIEGYYLLHFGVKGMRWGVRRSLKQLGYKTNSRDKNKEDIVLNKGTTFQRIVTSSNSGYTKGVYTSYKTADKDLYKGVLGRMRVQSLLKETGDVSLKELSMVAKKDIRIPSKETRLKEFSKLYNDDKAGVMNLINDHEVSRYGRKEKSGFDLKDKRQLTDAYEKFNDALSVGTHSPHGHVIEKYYDTLSKKGYDAIPDENDIRLSTFKAQAPIIMFNTAQSIGRVKVRELSASEVYNAYRRTIVKKVIRDLTMPGRIGSEKLSPDLIKRASQHARQLEKDKFDLNKNYTLKDLASDWQTHRLSTSQISRVSSKMDEGKTHDESVKEIVGVGNVAVDYLLDKMNL